ncbi:MAG: phosphatidate cytidylyltransferase [Beutenbergiaceae bacterium]
MSDSTSGSSAEDSASSAPMTRRARREAERLAAAQAEQAAASPADAAAPAVPAHLEPARARWAGPPTGAAPQPGPGSAPKPQPASDGASAPHAAPGAMHRGGHADAGSSAPLTGYASSPDPASPGARPGSDVAGASIAEPAAPLTGAAPPAHHTRVPILAEELADAPASASGSLTGYAAAPAIVSRPGDAAGPAPVPAPQPPMGSAPKPSQAGRGQGVSSRRRPASEGSDKNRPGGRNLPVAIAVGAGLILLVLAALFLWRKEAFLGLVIVACGLALWELKQAFAARDVRLPLLPLLVGTVGMLISAHSAGVEALLVACALTAGGAFIWRVLDGGGLRAMRDATAAIFATAYVPFLAGFVALMLTAEDGAWRVVALIAVTVANDTGGYIAGVLFGRHKLAPHASPNKSWEGLAGSAVLASAVAVSLMVFVLDGPWWAGVTLGVVGVLAATIGDLAESLLKRDLGIKDMGTLLPGHGGVLDRIDSMLFAAPVTFVLFYFVLGAS